MADTVIIELNSGAWTDVSTAIGSDGFLTNVGTQRVVYLEASTPPAASSVLGHRLTPSSSVNYSAGVGSVIYARSVRGVGKLAATGG